MLEHRVCFFKHTMQRRKKHAELAKNKVFFLQLTFRLMRMPLFSAIEYVVHSTVKPRPRLCTSELQLKVNCRIKFGRADQPKFFPTIHFQLQFTCTWSGPIYCEKIEICWKWKIIFYRMENNANPPKEEMVGGLTYGPAPFEMRVSLRF